MLESVTVPVEVLPSVVPPVGGGGNGTEVTPTPTFAVAVPPAPVQLIEYEAVAVGETVALPEVPDAVKPVPVQEVALVEDQVRVDD